MKFIQLKKIFLSALGMAALTFVNISNVYSISIAEKAREKVVENRQFIYSLEIPMKNFGSTEQKNDYNAIKDQYMIGLGYFYEGNYVNSYKELLDAQIKLDKLYEKISMDYIERTTKILQELVKSAVEIDIEFNKDSDLVRRFQTDREAPKEKVAYDPKKFHFVYDKRTIARNIALGFSHLGDAKRIRDEAVSFEEKNYEEGQKVDPAIYKYRLNNYQSVIDLCRAGKKNAFNVYQLINRNEVYSVQKDFKGNRFARESKLLPVFDPRIPDNYKIDASDTLNLVHEDEINIKRNLGEVKGGSATPKAETPVENTKTQEPQNQTPNK
ncbi:MAG: hypothetical protein OEV78_08620 [Spirochaetia bacterium]|nr:hypothetical protein [Spirochaetia bacterium]